MMFDTSSGMQISSVSVTNYLDSLVNKFFKILPMREESEPSLYEYVISLQRELIGFGSMVVDVGSDKLFVSILSVLQFFIDNVSSEDCSVKDIRGEVFHVISLCNKLKEKYSEGGVAV